MQIKHRIEVKGDKFKFLNPELFKRDLQGHDGKEAYITIAKPTSIRSNNQNRYYWGVVIQILSQETGNTRTTLHEYLKDEFLGKRVIEMFGKKKEVSISSTDLDTKEFEDYLSKIRIWASAELSIFIPEPNEVEY